ncbi:unnamed protein product, partial [Prorocentrum cordatum]
KRAPVPGAAFLGLRSGPQRFAAEGLPGAGEAPRREGGRPLAEEAPWGAELGETSLLNVAVRELWPEMTRFVSRILKESVEDSIKASVPWFLQGLGFGSLSFGESAIELEQVDVRGVDQVCSWTGPVRDLKVTAQINWDAAVDVSWKANSGTLIFEQVAIKGSLVIYLKRMLPRPPFFSGLRIYFADPPPSVALKLTIEALGQALSPIWLENQLASAIRNALIAQLMLPRVAPILLDINDDDAWFQVRRVLPEGVLHIRVERASGLAPPPSSGLPPWLRAAPSRSACCQLQVGDSRWRTVAKHRTLSPEWSPEEGTHRFLVHSLADQTLEVQLLDSRDSFGEGGDLLGARAVPLEDLAASERHELQLFSGGLAGTACLRARWAPLVLGERAARQALGRARQPSSRSRALDADPEPEPAWVLFLGVDRCSLAQAAGGRSFTCEVECEGAKATLGGQPQRARGLYGEGWAEGGQGEGTAPPPSGAPPPWSRQGARPSSAPSGPPRDAADEEFDSLDANNDGCISRQEYRAARLLVEEAAGEPAGGGGGAAAASGDAGAPAPPPEGSRDVHFQAVFTHLLIGSPESTEVHLRVASGLFAIGSARFDVSRLLYAPANTERIGLALAPSNTERIAEALAGDAGAGPRLHVLAQLRVACPE